MAEGRQTLPVAPTDSSEPKEDPDFYIRTIASTWGHLDLIKEWIPHHRDDRAKITDHVLIPAAMYGQLEVLKFALKDGDPMKKDSAREYAGWTLMHFAVDGAQRNMIYLTTESEAQEEDLVYGSPNEIVSGTPPLQQPKTNEEVKWRQMDIIYYLAQHGVPITEKDSMGHSPSDKASMLDEIDFTEGAMLLDILALIKSDDPSGAQEPRIETPALSRIPGDPHWRAAILHVIEWAYHRRNYDILKFCHQRKYATLSSSQLILSSPQLVQKGYQLPILIDALRREDFGFIKFVLDLSRNPTNVFNQPFEWQYGSVKRRETLLSFACSKFLQMDGGNQRILLTMLSPNSLGKNLTQIVLVGVGLRRLPAVIMHENLRILDVQENNLSSYPTTDTTGSNLNWKCLELEVFNFSHNLFTFIHPDIFHLPCLLRLSASYNNIQEVPMELWTAPRLRHLDLSHNKLQTLPCPPSINMANSIDIPQHVARSFSFRGRLPGISSSRVGYLQSTRRTYINLDIQSSSDLHKSQIGFSLHTLDLSSNQIMAVPKGLACLAPLLNSLKLNSNRITSLGCVSDYPPTLKTLDVSCNGVVDGIQMNGLDKFACVQSQLSNAPSSCSHCNHQRMNYLLFLYLSNNRLEDIAVHFLKQELDYDSGIPNLEEEEEEKIELIFPLLQGLRLSHNRLLRLPENIHLLEKLSELTFDGNPGILQLPPNLHLLTKLFTIKYEGISDPIVTELRNFRSAPDILYYLKARATQAYPNRSMRLLIIGHYHKGKSTLLQNLTSKPPESSFDRRARRIRNSSQSRPLSLAERKSTVGIECGKWECGLKRRGAPRDAPKINFYTWDFAGQEEYYVTHQCFLTNRGLYLLVWNVKDGSPGIESLNIWLQNLQARAHGFSHTVIIVGTHIDELPRLEREEKIQGFRDMLERYRIGRMTSRGYPIIKDICFVGCPLRGRPLDIDILNDAVYNTAMEMESPNDGEGSLNLRIKTLEEKIPSSYDQLRQCIEELAADSKSKLTPPIIKKDEFCKKVQEVMKDPSEIEAAVDFLYATTGVVLHFKIPVIEDYYIIDPQRWFDLCSLVISPDNVSSLVRAAGRPGDERFGLLSTAKMDEEFHMQRCDRSVSRLIRTFLNELHIIHQVNHDYCLVPSAIESDPVLTSQAEHGSFPRAAVYQIQRMESDSFPTVGPMVINSYDKHHMEVRETGLIYRRMLLLPPIASGFWSKLIALFLQKADFQQIIKAATPRELALHPSGPAHRLRSMIGNLELAWIYWKTGIVLYVGEKVALRVNGLQESEFSDPQTAFDARDSVYSARRNKLRLFHYQGECGWQSVPSHFKEVIEVVVPEVYIVRSFSTVDTEPPLDLSAKILAKALEIIDEVLKNHCEHLATTGIYSLNDMLHVVPCAICYGDRDERPQDDDDDDSGLMISESFHPHEALIPHLLQNGVHLSQRHEIGDTLDVHDRSTPTVEPGVNDSLRDDAIHVFTVDMCIKQTFTADYVLCPKHGPMEIQYLAPDLVFADLVDVKIEKHQLNDLVRKGDRPAARGAFGSVFKRNLRTKEGDSLEVAVKLFEQLDDLLPNTAAELTRSYSDMRFELNKLSTLSHPYVVKFIGVLTNPHSFVLEWAPLKSLEHIRQQHANEKVPFCPMSIAKVLMQVTSALAYLHSPTEVGIVHRDLKNGNILVFRFPDIAHKCFTDIPGGSGNCDVFVKLTDMGVCANPLAYNAKALGGLRQFVPECVTHKASWSLTEKVDIFSLGSCLYELMTLRGLPPSDIGEPEYKNMLLAGKRAQFYAKDSLYPLVFFQFLEDCWYQEHFKRPSAACLCRAVQYLSGSFDVSSDLKQPKERRELCSVLLDSYTLHQGHRISASQTIVSQDLCASLCMCLAFSSPEDYCTTIAIAKYSVEDPRTELQAEHVGQIKEGIVTAVHMTSTEEVLIGCDDGKLIHYDSERTRSISNLSCDCRASVEHGGIIKIHYDPLSKLLIIGFDHGRVHIKKCTQGLRNSLFGGTQWRECCCSLQSHPNLFALECLMVQGSGDEPASPSSPPNLELWCGTKSHEVEVWSLEVAQSATWSTGTVDQIRKVQQVSVNIENGEASVKLMNLSGDQTKIAVALATSNTPIIAILDVEAKLCLKSIPFSQSVATVLVSSSKLAIGTYEGEVYVFDIVKLLKCSEPTEHRVTILKAHIRTVYSLVSLKTCISPEGVTTSFPTFVGKAQENYERELLISTGYGRGYLELRGESKAFSSFYQQGGCYVNTWFL